MRYKFRPDVVLLLVALAAPLARAADWPQFRGPAGIGTSEEKGLPTEWNAKGKNVAWKVELPPGTNPYASPVVFADKVFVAVSRDEKPRAHQVVCLSAEDGKTLWTTDVPPGPWASGRNNGYPTPAVDAEHVYVAFGTAVVACLDHTGKVVWRKELEKYNFDVAMGSSPVLVGDAVVLLCDQTSKTSSLIAFDGKTGDIRWEAKRPDMNFAHSTPVLARIGEAPVLLAMASKGLQAIDPATGELRWTCKGEGDTSSPVYERHWIYGDGGRGAPGVAVNVAALAKDQKKVEPDWRTDRMPESLSSPVIVKGPLYRLQGKEDLVCRELETGKELYKGKLPGASGWASPVATADGLLYFASGGKSYVVRAGPTFEVVSVNDLADANHASAAIANGRIFIRGAKHLWCVKQGS